MDAVSTVLLLLLAGFGNPEDPKLSLYVFLPSNIRPHAMQSALEREIPDMEIFVFGRYREFRRFVSDNPPDAILAPSPVTEDSGGFVPVLHATYEGDTEEKYVFLSVGKGITLEDLNSSKIGVIDLMGRTRMRDFLGEKIGVPVSLRTVGKLEDLLTLLQYQNVGAIVVPESKISFYRDRTRLELIETNLNDIKVGLPVLATRNGDEKVVDGLQKAFLGLKPEINREILGVETWRRP
jgi:hypothetical protein